MIPIRAVRRCTLLVRCALLVAASAALLVASGHPAAGAEPAEVRIKQHQYAPQAITVPRGTTIRWVNDDDDPHTVTSENGTFASRGIDTHEEFTFTFNAPGTYAYHCALHPTMTGSVVVK